MWPPGPTVHPSDDYESMQHLDGGHVHGYEGIQD